MAVHHKIKTLPSVEPVTLAEMRGHLGITQITDTARDTIITGRITSARMMAEEYCRRAFITQTWGGYSDQFPGQPALAIVAITVPVNKYFTLRGDLQSVNWIKYVDNNGTQQTLDPATYAVDTIQGKVWPTFGNDWPACRQQPNSVQIEYLCGYGDTATTVPEPIKDAIRFIVGQWEMFQSSMEGVTRPFTMPNAAKELLDFYIDHRQSFNNG